MTQSVLMHLAESTAFAAAAWLLMAAFRVRNPGVRHAAWLIAMAKFLLPMVLIAGLGCRARTVAPRTMPAVWPSPVAQRTAAPVRRMPDLPFELVWLSGAGIALGIWLRRLAHWRSTTAATVEEAAALDRRRIGLGIRQRVALRYSLDGSGPCVAGIVRPEIRIPRALEEELGTEAYEAVLLHELAHVKRRDNLWNALAHVVASVFWFHPLLWWMERQVRAESDRACDALAVEWGAAPEIYARGILRVCRLHVAGPAAGVSGIGLGVGDRIEWILSLGQTRRGRFARALPALLAMAITAGPFAIGLLTRAPLRAQTSASAARPGVSCYFMGVRYGEGVVMRQADGRNRMCVADPQTGGSKWVHEEQAGRSRVGDVLAMPERAEKAARLICEPKPSAMYNACSCESGNYSLGAFVSTSDGATLRCDRWLLAKLAAWRTAIKGVDY